MQETFLHQGFAQIFIGFYLLAKSINFKYLLLAKSNAA
jgi:hypothetical protein